MVQESVVTFYMLRRVSMDSDSLALFDKRQGNSQRYFYVVMNGKVPLLQMKYTATSKLC
jgi:hypothetical protein